MSLPASGHFPAGAREGFSLPGEVLGTGGTVLLDPATRSEPVMPQVPPLRLEIKSRDSSTGELAHPPRPQARTRGHVSLASGQRPSQDGVQGTGKRGWPLSPSPSLRGTQRMGLIMEG